VPGHPRGPAGALLPRAGMMPSLGFRWSNVFPSRAEMRSPR